MIPSTKVAADETFPNREAERPLRLQHGASHKQIARRRGRSIALTDREIEQLRRWMRGRTTPQRLALRSRIVLLLAGGLSIRRAAAEARTSVRTVVLWRNRVNAGGVGRLLHDAPGRGRKPTIAHEVRLAIAAERDAGAAGQHRATVRAAATKYGVSRSTVQRIWARAAAGNSGTRTTSIAG